jgi:hypothetical protein
MPLQTKGLWAEDLNSAATRARFIQHVKDTGANVVSIRTTSPLLQSLIPTFHQMQVKVYGWRWPHAFPDPKYQPDPEKNDPAYVPNEAAHVVNDLIKNGLDGYIFDIESDEGNPPHPYDWDNKNIKNLKQLATDLASGIKAGFDARGTPYVLGLTSHARGFSNYPGILWQPFLDVSSVLFPQTYWRYRDNNNVCRDENPDPNDPNHKKGAGTPEQAMINGFNDYTPKGKPIIPLAGEIGCATADEIGRFGGLVAARGLKEAHFYVDIDDAGFANPGVLKAIKAL